jgi:hypothetical protein
MGRDDIRTNVEVTLRYGWEESNSSTYDYVVDGMLRGYVVDMFDGYGWMVVVFAKGRGDNSHMCRIDTAEEAMVWVETTSAIVKE